MKSTLNHVAILVSSIEAVLKKKLFSSELLFEIEEFPPTGTRELYIGQEGQIARILLMQAIGDGPYKRALNKRGPGIHHIALDVLGIDAFVANQIGSGWLLHAKSLSFYNSHKQVYLSRPGVPVLIEVQERKSLVQDNYFIQEIEFPFKDWRLLNSLGCDRLKMADEIKMKIADKQLSVADLL